MSSKAGEIRKGGRYPGNGALWMGMRGLRVTSRVSDAAEIARRTRMEK